MPVLLETVGNLGAFVIIIWLYIREKTDSKITIETKDNELRELNSKVLSAFQNTASTHQRLNATIKENTKAVETLTERVTDVLINK